MGRMIEFFQYNKEQREQLLCILHYLSKEDYDGAASLLYKGAPELPSIRSWVLPALFGMIASLVSIPFMGVRAVVLVAIFFIMNMVIHNKINRYTEAAMPGIRYITRMLIARGKFAPSNCRSWIMAITIFLPKWWTSVRSFCGKTVRWPRALRIRWGLANTLKLCF